MKKSEKITANVEAAPAPTPTPISIPTPAPLPTPTSRPLLTIHISRRVVKRIALLLVALLIILGLARFFHFHNWGLSPEQIQQQQVAALVQKVSALILLPVGDTPIVATVSDAASLKSQQSFYQNASNGDVLMIYTQAQRAILYRPSVNKIINVGPIYINQNGTTQESATTDTSKATSTPSHK